MDIEEVWEHLITQLKSYPNVNDSQIDAFFSRLKIQAVSSGFIMLTSQTSFIKEWVETHYLQDIKQALEDIYHVDFFIQIEVDPSQPVSNTIFPVPSPASLNGSTFNQVGTTQQGQNQQSRSVNNGYSALQEQVNQTGQINHNNSVNQLDSFQRSTPLENIDTQTVVRTVPQSISQNHDAIGEQTQTQKAPLDTQSGASFNISPTTAQGGYTDSLTGVGTNTGSTQGTNIAESPLQTSHVNSIIPGYSFSNFVIGESNRMAYMVAEEVASRPGIKNYNPLFIHGRSGVGKTHLMCAINNFIIENYPDEFRVFYIDSMELVNSYSLASIERSVDKNSFKNFDSFFDDIDVLLIDDVQNLQGKSGTLDMVFQILNKMIVQGKQMILAADRAPKNIDIDERYQSRFVQGTTIDIQPPDDETKRNIIKSFIHQREEEEGINFALDERIIDYIVERSSSNVREVRSAVNTIILEVKMNQNAEISNYELERKLENHFLTQTNRITVDVILKSVEEFFKIKAEDLFGKSRKKNVNHARQIAIYLIRQLLNEPYEAIGEIFNRNHTTIMYSNDQIELKLKEERDLAEEVEAIRKLIKYH